MFEAEAGGEIGLNRQFVVVEIFCNACLLGELCASLNRKRESLCVVFGRLFIQGTVKIAFDSIFIAGVNCDKARERIKRIYLQG